jgi:hypothetical protein
MAALGNEEATGTLVTRRWQDRTRGASGNPQAYQRDRQTRGASPLFCCSSQLVQGRMSQVASTRQGGLR